MAEEAVKVKFFDGNLLLQGEDVNGNPFQVQSNKIVYHGQEWNITERDNTSIICKHSSNEALELHFVGNELQLHQGNSSQIVNYSISSAAIFQCYISIRGRILPSTFFSHLDSAMFNEYFFNKYLYYKYPSNYFEAGDGEYMWKFVDWYPAFVLQDGDVVDLKCNIECNISVVHNQPTLLSINTSIAHPCMSRTDVVESPIKLSERKPETGITLTFTQSEIDALISLFSKLNVANELVAKFSNSSAH